jgi:sugar phosphate isomerase/epimerase
VTVLLKQPEIGICWGSVAPATLVEIIEAAARNGFPTITLDPVHYYDSIEAGINGTALRRRLTDAGVRARVVDGIWTGIAGLPSEPVKVGDNLMKRYDATACLEVAQALDAPIINFGHYLADPVPRAAIAEGVGAACRLVADSGVTIVLEFILESGMPSVTEAQAVSRWNAANQMSASLSIPGTGRAQAPRWRICVRCRQEQSRPSS